MNWNRSQLDEALEAKDFRIRNFFDTFGFVVIRDFLSKTQWAVLSDEYNKQYALRSAEAPPGGMRFLPNFVDSSEKFTEFFFSDEMQAVYRYFAGEDFLYLGSDGSQFLTTSFPWHRDWFTRMPLLKFNFYFNPPIAEGGRFMIIPGSQFAGDTYAGLLQNTMSWPLQNKNPGGMNENNFLPQTINPRRSPDEFVDGQADVPHVEIELGQGDLILFDHRCIHCVQATSPAVPRRLLTVLLSKNAMSFSDEHYLIKAGHKRESLMSEVVDLVVSERNHIGCNAYGDAIRKHSFSMSRHFIRIQPSVSNSSLRYAHGIFTLPDGGSFQTYLDSASYAAIGAAYRQKVGDTTGSPDQSQAYSYGDVHLGINAQNIVKVSNT